MPRGQYPRHAAAPWSGARIQTLSAVALWRVYREELDALRAAAAPAVSDRRREALVNHVCRLRIELRRRHLLPASPREASWPEA